MLGSIKHWMQYANHGAISVLASVPGLTVKAASVRGLNSQTVNSSVPKILSWHSPAMFDTGSFFNGASPTIFTIPTTGLYIVCATCLWDETSMSGAGTFTLNFQWSANPFGGSPTGWNEIANSTPQEIGNSITAIMSMTAGDTISVQAINSSSANVNVISPQITDTLFSIIGFQ